MIIEMLNRGIIVCWALLLLTALPKGIVGRHIPEQIMLKSLQCRVFFALISTTLPLALSTGPPARVSMQTPGVEAAAATAAGHLHMGGTLGHGTQSQEGSSPPHRKILLGVRKEVDRDDSIYGHRLLVGSSPPTCLGKCGACIPCNPIHVSIGSPHGALTQQEYYPEVWRCKCGNRLFMP
uniref:Epidermal patterning factor-like protein n=1 Tax=Physcomitrium patens TaxID=3218 RepID=A0A7I4DXF1_PHYPA